jgi:hypothetical protein
MVALIIFPYVKGGGPITSSYHAFMAFVIMMFRKASRGLVSLGPPMPFMAWQEELRKMAVGLPARRA